MLHFLLLGGLLFFLYERVKPSESSKDTIVLDDESVRRVVSLFEKEWARKPTAEELKGLLERQLQQEIFYRQAIRMNLDHNDEIIKRRLEQKLRFITSDLANLQQPNEDSLKAYYATRMSRYAIPPRLSFIHIYFSPENRKDPQADAQALLRVIAQGQYANNMDDLLQQGDPFPYLQRVEQITVDDVSRQMGRGFAEALLSMPVNAWRGPVMSGFGAHLVYVERSVPAGEPLWADIRQEVIRDYQYDFSQRINEQVYLDFRKQYDIRLDIRDTSLVQLHLDKLLGIEVD